MSSQEVVDQIGGNPKFHQLVRTRSRISWGMFATVTSLYYLLMMAVAFYPEVLRIPLSEGSVVTIGWPLGAAVIVVSWLLTGWYIRSSNNQLEPLNEAVLKGLKK